MAGMERLKEKIKQNGHFKDLKGFDFSVRNFELLEWT
jgi:hypothetical protein